MLKILGLTLLLNPLLALGIGHDHQDHFHLPLEMTTEEYQDLLRRHWLKFGDGAMKANELEVQTAIDGGERFSKWLKKINQNRAEDNQIRLSSETSRGGGIPIDRPSKYGPKTIKERLTKILSEMPEAMKEVIYGEGKVSNTLPEGVTEQDFVKHGRMSNFLYQTAVRWSTAIVPWLDYFKRNKRRDVRGYFHLKKMNSKSIWLVSV